MNKTVNCITFTCIIKVNGNLNGSWGEDIISTIKKIRMPDSTMRTYISGQALRRMSRDQLKAMGYHISKKKPDDVANDKQPIPTDADPKANIDDDVFGYMKTGGKKTASLSRISPVRVSPAIAMFPYNYERDLGLQNNNDIHAPNRIYETEISNNLYVYTVLIETDRVGVLESESLPIKERKERIKAVIKSFQYLWGGGKQSRLLVDPSPKFIAYQSQFIKKPSYLDYINVDENINLNIDLLQNGLDNSKNISLKTLFGLDNIIKNHKEIKEKYGDIVNNVNDAFENIYGDIDQMTLSEFNDRN
jgi:CRISPR-associated protein Cas7/Cst2/DevR subtype I-B